MIVAMVMTVTLVTVPAATARPLAMGRMAMVVVMIVRRGARLAGRVRVVGHGVS